MRRLLLAAIATLLLAGCGDRAGVPAGPARSASADPSRPAPLDAPVVLRFWLESDATQATDPRIVQVLEHPCGTVATLRVASIPEPTATIRMDQVVELGAAGEELAVWRVPTDASHVAVRGDMIALADNGGLSLWTDPQGRLYDRPAAPGTLPGADPVLATCPHVDRFEGSSYLQCYHLADADTGKPRLFASEGICS